MRRLLAILVSLLVALNFVWVKPAPAYAAVDYSTIRVRLNSMGSKATIPVTVQGSYTIMEDSSIKLEQKTYTVRIEKGKLILTDGSKSWNLGNKLTFKRNHGNLRMNNTSYGTVDYLGDMEFKLEGSSIVPINHIHLELYLYGVVPSEMPNSWHLEALKAQAVAARSYAAEKIRVNGSSAHHLLDDQWDQVYKGYNKSTSRSIEAVDSTMGQILKHGSSIAQTFYSSSNGGKTERAGNIFSRDLPYLIIQDDPYDINNPSNPNASWTVKYNKTPVDSSLKKRILSSVKDALGNGYSKADADISIEKIKEVQVDKNDSGRLASGRLVLEVNAKKTDGTNETVEVSVNLTRSNTRSLLDIRSLLFSVEDSENEIVIKGGGFGHGVGMSQYGAWQMAKEGKSFSDILAFYYPGTSLASLGIKAPQHPDYIPSEPAPSPSPEPTPSPAPSATYGRVKVSTSLNIRKGAGTQHKIIGSLKNNARVEIIGESGQWYKIKTGSLTGYVSKTYIVLETEPPKTDPTPPPNNSPSPPTDTAPPPDQDKRTGIVTASALNVRSGPGTKNHVVGMVVKGKQITIHEKTGEWYKITYNGINGYVHSSYVQVQQSQTPAPTPTPTPANPITATLRNGSRGSQVTLLQQRLNELGYNCGKADGIFGSKTLSAVRAFQRDRGLTVDGIVGAKTRAALNAGGTAASPPSRGESSQTQMAVVTASSLNVRSGAGTGYRIIGSLKRNALVEILSRSGSWYRIKYGSGTGYVHGDYLKFR